MFKWMQLMASCIFCLEFGVPTPAFADRPLFTEVADVAPAGDCSIEAARDRYKGPDGYKSLHGDASVECGIGGRTQLTADVSRSRESSLTSRGLSLGGLTSLVDGDEDSPGLSVSYGISRLRESGGKFRHEATALGLVGSWPVGEVLLHGNVGTKRNGISSSRATLWSVAVEYGATSWLDLTAEAFGDDKSGCWHQVGVRWKIVGEYISMYGAYGRQPASGNSLLQLGFRLAY